MPSSVANRQTTLSMIAPLVDIGVKGVPIGKLMKWSQIYRKKDKTEVLIRKGI